MSKQLTNSRELFLKTLKAELGVKKMEGNKVVQSSNEDKSLIALFEDILNEKTKVADFQIHSVRPWVADVKFFKQDDNIKVGIRSISESMLKKGEFFVPTGIQLLVAPILDSGGNSAAYTDDLALNANFKPIGEVAAASALKQAEWFMRHDQKYVVPEHSTAQVFDTSANEIKGMFFLDTPRFLSELKRIEVDLQTLGTIPANYAVKIVLQGAGTLPN